MANGGAARCRWSSRGRTAAYTALAFEAIAETGNGLCTLVAGGTSITLPPMLYAWYALFARRAGTGNGDAIAIRHIDLQPADLPREYARVVAPASEAYAILEQQLRRNEGVCENFFREKTAKVNRRLNEALGVEAGAYRIAASGRRPVTRYAIRLPVERIELE